MENEKSRSGETVTKTVIGFRLIAPTPTYNTFKHVTCYFSVK